MATASLVVRILADIGSFTSGLSKAEREMVKTASRLESAGKSLSLGVTLPLVALGGAIANAAAEDEASVKKLERTFGTAGAAMEGFIQDLMRTVPATDDEIRGLTVSTDVLLRSMGLSAPKAVQMTQAVTKLAGDLAAFNHVQLEVAQDALEKGLAGKTRGLAEFGIVINEADVKTRAYALGLAKAGDELSHATVAQASWSLILDRTKDQQGEAARTIGDASNALARLRQAADGVGDSFGAIVLPAAAKVVDVISGVLKAMNDLSPATKGAIVTVAAFAAGVGPAIFVVGSLIRNITLLRGAFLTLKAAAAGSTFAAFATSAAALGPAALIVIPILAALGAKMYFDGKAAQQAASDVDKFKLALQGLSKESLTAGLQAMQKDLVALQAKRNELLTKKATAPDNPDLGNVVGSKTDFSNQIAKVDAQIKLLRASFDPVVQQMVAMGIAAEKIPDTIQPSVDKLKEFEDRARLITEAFQQMGEGWNVPELTTAWAATLELAYDKLLKIGHGLDPIAIKLKGIIDDLQKAASAALPGVKDLPGVQVTPRATTQPMPAKIDIAGPVASTLPKIPEQLSTIRQATRQGTFEVVQAIQGVGYQLSGVIGGLTGAFADRRNSIGGQIGGALGGAFGGGVGGVLGSKVSEKLGGLLGAGLGSVVPVVGTLIGGALGSAIGGLFGRHKKSVDQANTAMENLAKTVDRVNASISNMPQWFKIAQFRFAATAPVTPTPQPSPAPAPTPSAPSGDPTDGGNSPEKGGDRSSSRSPVFNIQHLTVQSTATTMRQLLAEIEKAAFEKQSTGAASGFDFAFQSR